MSSGKVHTTASVILSVGFLTVGEFQGSVGALIGIFVSPDCDVDSGFSADTYIRKSVGRVFEMVWDIVWFPYRKVMKHGSFASHFPVVGTLGRIIYIWLVMVAFYVILSFIFPRLDILYELGWWLDRITEHRNIVIGLMGADLIHYILDILTKESST